jgi:hypothetical protein
LGLAVKAEFRDPPRTFVVGFADPIELKDCGSIRLDPDEQLTFTTEDGGEYDVTRKDWGFYATPSLNGRLVGFGLRGVLVRNRLGRYFVLLVEKGREELFERYRSGEELIVVAWLDDDEELARLDPARP